MFDFLSNKFSNLFSRLTGQNRLTEHNMQETLQKVKDALLEADVPYQLVETFLAEVSAEVVGQKVLTASLKPGEHLIKIIHDKLVNFLGGTNGPEMITFQIPSIIMLIGLQGSGKTTTIAKLAYFVQKAAEKRGKKRKILLASVDFYRPAALNQLEILAQQIGVDFYRSPSQDPLIAAADINKFYKDNGYELLFFDTAGRMHIDSTMLQELRLLDAKIQPKYKYLVLDSMTGQESLRVAQAFEESIGFHGAILTKIDSDTRGGAAFAFRYTIKKPIVFMGAGEKVGDLEYCRPERMAGRILGMGDIQSLIERAQDKIKESEQDALEKSINKGKMTLQDFASQLQMVSKIGSLSQIINYLPGISSQQVSPDMIQKGEAEIKRFQAIINSMTMKERLCPQILNGSRKQRIAKGSGVTVTQINEFLERFEKSQQFMKMFKKFGRMPGMF
jgi:signal recognition particle subunit SRP54